METHLVIESKNNYLLLPQNIVIGQCLADQLFASAFSFGKLMICSPEPNHDSSLILYNNCETT